MKDLDKEANNYNGNELSDRNSASPDSGPDDIAHRDRKVRFEIIGEEMVEKTVKLSGNSGRAYLPPLWLGHKVKIVRID